jgi:hypothetical protein
MDCNAIKDLFSKNNIDLEIKQIGNEYNISISTKRYINNIVKHRVLNSSVVPGIICDKSLLNGFDYKSINYDYTSTDKITMSIQKKDLLFKLIVSTREKEIFDNSGVFIDVDYEKCFLVPFFKQVIDYLE